MVCTFDDLPNELILFIFSFISEKDICLNCSFVCKRWNELSTDKFLNKARVRIQNGDDLTQIFKDTCYNSNYLSFDYISSYVSENHHKLKICCKNFWGNGLMIAIESNDTKIVKRFIRCGIPETDQSIDALYRALYHAIVSGSLDMVKILTKEYNYKWHSICECIELAKRHKNLKIIEYLESLD